MMLLLQQRHILAGFGITFYDCSFAAALVEIMRCHSHWPHSPRRMSHITERPKKRLEIIVGRR